MSVWNNLVWIIPAIVFGSLVAYLLIVIFDIKNDRL